MYIHVVVVHVYVVVDVWNNFSLFENQFSKES
jgi:hypothetical protein